MKYSVPIISALAMPMAHAWSSQGGFGVFVRPDSGTCVRPDPLDRLVVRPTRDTSGSRRYKSLRYEIDNTDRQVQISLDVPGVDASAIDVSIRDDVLAVSGKRDEQKFSQRFLLDPTVDVDQFTARLKNGVLVMTAPKNVPVDTVRRIAVTDIGDAASSVQENLEETQMSLENLPTSNDAASETNANVAVDVDSQDETAKDDEEESTP